MCIRDRTGALTFQHAKPGLIRGLIAERTDPALFALSYDYVGDLSETVALMWPAPGATPPLPGDNALGEAGTVPLPPLAAGRGQGWGVI